MTKMFERRKIPGVRRVPKKELRELAKLPWVVDEALSDRSFEARALPDGRVLHVLRIDGSANLFPSREALAQLVREMKEMEAEVRNGGGVFDPAKELLPPLADFIRDVDKHAKSLGKVLRIPDEALDRSVESLDLVDKALLRVRLAKRMTPEVFTPVTAYLGEVMRLVCDGRWGTLPAAIKKKQPTYDPVEYAPHQAALQEANKAAMAAGAKAEEEARARRASPGDAAMASHAAYNEVLRAFLTSTPAPRPTGFVECDQRIYGHEHEPVIRAHDGALVQPVASVVRTFMERSTYGTLRAAVEGHLAPYLIAKRKAAAATGGRS
jgi:hypothetical protein